MEVAATKINEPVQGQLVGVSRKELAENLRASANELLRIAHELEKHDYGQSCSEYRGDIRITTERRDFDMTSIIQVKANFVAVLSL